LGIWKRVKNVFRGEQRDAYSGTGYDFIKWFNPANIFAGRVGNTLATNETIFSAVSRLSNAMASLPVKLYENYKPVRTHMSDLVENSPNQNMTSFDFIRTLETHRNTSGNGYALKMYDNNYQVSSFAVLDPSKVQEVIEKETLDLWYEVTTNKGKYLVHNMDMIHVKHIQTNGYRGINPLDVLKNTTTFDSSVRQFSLDQMDTAIKASFLLKMATNLSKDKKAEILANFKEFYKENGGVIIQELGTEINAIERKFIDTKVFEVEKITRSRVATVYNMPVHMLGETGGGYSSMEQLAIEFVQGTMVPIVRQYEQEFNRKLLTTAERLRGLSYKFNVNALLRGDIKTRAEFYFKGVRSAWFKPNEVRAFEELPPVPGGDKLYISGDLHPIDEPRPNAGKGVKIPDEPETDT